MLDVENAGPQLIKQILNAKKKINPSYSLNAIARDLNISQPHLSRIMHGKSRMTPRQAYKIGKYLKLDNHALLKLIESTLLN